MEALWLESNRHGLLLKAIVIGLKLGRWAVSDGFEQPVVVKLLCLEGKATPRAKQLCMSLKVTT